MRICDLVEELVVYHAIAHLTDQEKTQLIRSYNQSEWIKITQILLDGIGKEHHVPGKIVYQLRGMCQQYQYQELNREQMWLLFHSILENWNQMSCAKRAELDL